MEGIIQLAVILALVLIGYFFGKYAEQKHYRSIKMREEALQSIKTTADKQLPDNYDVERAWLVTGSVVISTDYFKTMAAGLKTMFGGRLKSYETLLDRGRREAMLRMKESAGDADMIINLRVETSSISGSTQSMGSIEVFAYGTAIKIK